MVDGDNADGLRVPAQIVERICERVGVEDLDGMDGDIQIAVVGRLLPDMPLEVRHEDIGPRRKNKIEAHAAVDGQRHPVFLGDVAEAGRRLQNDLASPGAHAGAVVEHPVNCRGGYARLPGDVA